MRDSKTLTALLFAFVLLSPVANAGKFFFKCKQCGKAVCKPEQKMKKVKKSYYEIECVEVCIPGIRWPWQRGCEPKCGRVRKVAKLVKKEHECEECVCEWKVIHLCDECSDCSCSEGEIVFSEETKEEKKYEKKPEVIPAVPNQLSTPYRGAERLPVAPKEDK